MTTFENGYNIADLKYNVSPVVKIVGKAKDDKDCPIPDSRSFTVNLLLSTFSARILDFVFTLVLSCLYLICASQI